jgi:hypothetical protein
MDRSPRRRDDDVLVREVAGEVFMVPIRGKLADLQDLFVLNRIGAWLWNRLDGSRSSDEIALDMASEFKIEISRAREDLALFLDELDDLDLLVGSVAASGQ